MPSSEIDYYFRRSAEERVRAGASGDSRVAAAHGSMAILYAARVFLMRAAAGDLSEERVGGFVSRPCSGTLLIR